MKTNLTDALDNSLARIASGESTLEECLADFPEQSAELKRLLVVSLKTLLQDLKASPEFKASARTRLLEHMRSNPRRPKWHQTPALRYASMFATLVLALATAGTALAQQALPGDVLYDWKLASERLWRSIQADRVDADLALVERRVYELRAIQGLSALEVIGVTEYAEQLLELRNDVTLDSGDIERVNAILASQKEILSDFFANSQADLPDPEELFGLIPLPVEETPSQDEGSLADPDLSVPPVLPPPIPPVKKEDG
ncbi:MAG: hypothetical protein WD740_01505 [Anaerolineales bacterium]